MLLCLTSRCGFLSLMYLTFLNGCIFLLGYDLTLGLIEFDFVSFTCEGRG